MKQLLLVIITAIVAFLILLSTLLFVALVLLFLGMLYLLLILKTHLLINNLWFEVPIDICMFGIIYSVVKVSRYHFQKVIDKIKED